MVLATTGGTKGLPFERACCLSVVWLQLVASPTLAKADEGRHGDDLRRISEASQPQPRGSNFPCLGRRSEGEL